MVRIRSNPLFRERIRKIRHAGVQARMHSLIAKIVQNPLVGKPMRNCRKGTREVYAGSYRLSYHWLREEDTLVFLDIYHKDEQ